MNQSEDSQNTQADLSIKSGMAHLYFAFDVGFSINLEETVRRITVGAAQPPVYSRPIGRNVSAIGRNVSIIGRNVSVIGRNVTAIGRNVPYDNSNTFLLYKE